MKKIWTKYLVLLCMVFAICSLTACSESKKDDDSQDDQSTVSYSEETVENLLEYIDSKQVDQTIQEQGDGFVASIDQLANTDRQELQQELPNLADQNPEVYAMVDAYLQGTKDAGEYQPNSAYGSKVEFDGTVLTMTVCMKYEKSDLKFTQTVDVETNETELTIEETEPEEDLTIGEIMQKAGMNTLLGMGTVFVVLILISLVISCFKFISAPEKKPEPKVETVKTEENTSSNKAADTQEENLADDLELVAVITAAIAASEGTSADGFRVRSIRRVGNAKWNRA